MCIFIIFILTIYEAVHQFYALLHGTFLLLITHSVVSSKRPKVLFLSGLSLISILNTCMLNLCQTTILRLYKLSVEGDGLFLMNFITLTCTIQLKLDARKQVFMKDD